MKLKGFDGLKQAMQEIEGPTVDMGAIRAAEIAHKMEIPVHQKAKEGRSLYADVPRRSYMKRKGKSKPKNEQGGKYHGNAPAQLGWYLGRFYY